MLFKNHQVGFVSIAFLLSVFIFVVLIRIFERPVTDSLGYADDAMNIGNLYNSIWFVIITMTTVGYGDMFAKTLYGRILNIFISIYGISIVSMIVSILQSFIMMDQPEKRTITVVKRLEAKKELEHKAAWVLTTAFRNILMLPRCLLFLRMQSHQYNPKRLKSKMLSLYFAKRNEQIQKYKYDFRQFNRKYKAMNDTDDIYGEMLRWFDLMRNEIVSLKDNHDQLNQFMNHVIESTDDKIKLSIELTMAQINNLLQKDYIQENSEESQLSSEQLNKPSNNSILFHNNKIASHSQSQSQSR